MVKNTSGFTLIEVVIVMAIMAVISVASVNVFLASTVSATKERVQRELKQNGDFIMAQLENDLRFAKEIEPCETDMDQIDIHLFDQTEPTSWGLNGSGTAITVDGETAIGGNVTLVPNTFSVDCNRDIASGVTTISIAFRLQKGQSTTDKKEEYLVLPFETTITLRNKEQ